jgi:hypothetical protein
MACLHEDWEALDPELPAMLEALRVSGAPEVWHKHGNFMTHLRGVWRMLAIWGQPAAVCRLGLFHSAYSNSFVSMVAHTPRLQPAPPTRERRRAA